MAKKGKRSRKAKVKVDESTRQVLTDQVKQVIQAQHLKALHAVQRQLREVAFYPEHDRRRESPSYKKVHDDLVGRQNRACIVCGVTNKILRDPKKRSDPRHNPFGARQMETHHRTIEWALANAVDPKKFNQRVLPGLRRRDPKKYAKPMTRDEIRDWVDHDPDNLWVVCDVHHRGRFVGIHEISDPIWGPQDLLVDDFAKATSRLLDLDRKAWAKKKRPSNKRKTTH